MKELEEYILEAISGKVKHNRAYSGLDFLKETSYNDMVKLMEEDRGSRNIHIELYSHVDDLFGWIVTHKWGIVSSYYLDGNTYTCSIGDKNERYAILICKEYIFLLYYTGGGEYKKMKVIETRNFSTITHTDKDKNSDDTDYLEYLANIFTQKLLR